jgi:hypothetical protein
MKEKKEISIIRIKLLSAITITLAITLTAVVFAQELYKITSKEMGFSSLDYTVTEIKRTDRISVLRIPGFQKRSAAASRWMLICVYPDLAQKRGFEYYAVVYPEPPSDDLIVGFPKSQNEDISKTLGPEFGSKNVISTTSVQKIGRFCKDMQKRQ